MKNTCVTLFFLIITVTILPGQQIGALFMGGNRYNINPAGPAAGWILPVDMTKLNICYKVKASHHAIGKYYSPRHNIEDNKNVEP